MNGLKMGYLCSRVSTEVFAQWWEVTQSGLLPTYDVDIVCDYSTYHATIPAQAFTFF